MKRVLSVILIFVILGDQIQLMEVARIPFLFRHFSEHKNRHRGDSAITFLYKHYVVNQKAESDQDKKSDAQLPFKSLRTPDTHFVACVLINKPVKEVFEPVDAYYRPYTPGKLLSRPVDIWQPPKI